jgi:hypothetical protein
MFLADADVGRQCLRQGDILEGILFPLLAADSILFLGSRQPARDGAALAIRPKEIALRNSPAWMCQVMTRIAYAAVISQCCDLEPHDGRIIRPTIALARLVEVPQSARRDEARLKNLKANKYPFNPEDPGYLHYFYVPTQERLGNHDWVIDYGQVLSIPSSEFPAVLGQRLLQMTDDCRIRFKVKLAAAYGRFTPEEEDSGHAWLADIGPAAPDPQRG